MGLITAISKFKFHRETQFITGAIWWIRLYVSKAVQNYSHTVRVPSNVTSVYKKVSKCMDCDPNDFDYQQKDIDELVEATGCTAEQIIDVLTNNPNTLSINEVNSPDNDNKDYDLEDEDAVNKIDTDVSVNTMLQCLNKTEAYIIKHLYGIGCNESSVQQLARQFHVMPDDIAVIRDSAMDKLRNVASA